MVMGIAAFPLRDTGAREELETGFEREEGGLDEVADLRESGAAVINKKRRC